MARSTKKREFRRYGSYIAQRMLRGIRDKSMRRLIQSAYANKIIFPKVNRAFPVFQMTRLVHPAINRDHGGPGKIFFLAPTLDVQKVWVDDKLIYEKAPETN